MNKKNLWRQNVQNDVLQMKPGWIAEMASGWQGILTPIFTRRVTFSKSQVRACVEGVALQLPPVTKTLL